jgi:hypothetical protein
MTKRGELASAEICDVDVGAEARVIGEVPAIVVGVFVDDNLIGAPAPAIAEGVVIRSYVEIKAAEPEAPGAAAFDAPEVLAAETAVEASVFPSMIDAIVVIVAAGIVADPAIVSVDVRSLWMAALVAVPAVILAVAALVAVVLIAVMLIVIVARRPRRVGAMRRNVATAVIAIMALPSASFLSESRNGTEQGQCDKS